jgi:hypothetical protein
MKGVSAHGQTQAEAQGPERGARSQGAGPHHHVGATAGSAGPRAVPESAAGGLIEPELRCTACGAPAIRSEERLVDRYTDGRFLGWALRVRTYEHPRESHTLALGAVFPARP